MKSRGVGAGHARDKTAAMPKVAGIARSYGPGCRTR